MKFFDEIHCYGPASSRPTVRLSGAPTGPVEQLVRCHHPRHQRSLRVPHHGREQPHGIGRVHPGQRLDIGRGVVRRAFATTACFLAFHLNVSTLEMRMIPECTFNDSANPKSSAVSPIPIQFALPGDDALRQVGHRNASRRSFRSTDSTAIASDLPLRNEGFPTSHHVRAETLRFSAERLTEMRVDGSYSQVRQQNSDGSLVRKPCKTTTNANVLKFGTGALNVGACRIDLTPEYVAIAEAPIEYWLATRESDLFARMRREQ
jgi:hypothetical protein